MELISSHIALINATFYRTPQRDSFPSHRLTPRPASAPAAEISAVLFWPTHRIRGRRKKKVLMFSKATGTLCLQRSWQIGYSKARAAAELGVLCSRDGVGGKAMKEVLCLLLQETEICWRFCFGLLCSFFFQIPPGARRRRN